MKLNEKKCPRCAEVIKFDAHVCRHCGHEFTAEDMAAAKAKVKKDSLGMGLGCLTVLILPALFVATCSSGSSSDNSTNASLIEESSPAEQAEAKARYEEMHRWGQHCVVGGKEPFLVDRVKRQLLDPDSFELIDTRTTVVDRHGKNKVVMRYRAKTRSGLVAPSEAIGVIDNKTCFLESATDEDGTPIP